MSTRPASRQQRLDDRISPSWKRTLLMGWSTLCWAPPIQLSHFTPRSAVGHGREASVGVAQRRVTGI